MVNHVEPHAPATTAAHFRGLSDEMQLNTRKEGGFAQAESSLPNPSSGALSTKLLTKSRGSVLSGLLSFLGSNNPKPQPIGPDDTVWLLDNVAFRDQASGRWVAEFVASTMEQRPSCKVIDAVQAVARTMGLDETDEDLEIIERRLTPFLQDILPGRQVFVLHGNGQQPQRLRLGPGGRNGISSDLRHLPDTPAGTTVDTVAQVPKGTDGILTCKTFFADPDSWAIVSDIDDTIKITQTSDPIGILRTTFLDEPTPVAGIPELYSWLRQKLSPASPWFYLSASPYNLYPFLSSFRDMYYPPGQIILRDESWMSVRGLLRNLTLGTEAYKVSRLQKLNGWLPRCKMIMIGDSTQSDPEAYGDIYREHAGWVKLILIRKVTDIAAIGMQSKNEPKRFEDAFADVPKEAWHVFEDPEECKQHIERVMGA